MGRFHVWCILVSCSLCVMDGYAQTRAEVDARVAEAGRTQPDWWGSVGLDYPAELRLDWPEPREEQRWEPRRNPGQYLTGVVYQDPRLWRSSARLFHHMLTVNEDRPAVRARIMGQLGHIYASLLADHARGAFWIRSAAEAGVRPYQQTVELAQCYQALGSREMAVDVLAGLEHANSSAVLAWAQLGELARALAVADAAAVGRQAAQAYLAAGQACRWHRDYARSKAAFGKVVGGALRGGRRRTELYRRCASEAVASLSLLEQLDLKGLNDGTYRAQATAYRGDVDVAVEVKNHAIASVKVLDHREDWFFTALESIPAQIVERQGFEEVDAVTGATVTSVAIINAAAKALGAASP
ncbi:MAG: FMN-binding protein [Kiritimatiellia bacterium]|nr:FMN-binding protein [Kiritimatiellia bacterium]MDP6811336.1 FMN-binding protein [Kiritimatiellia bacterium]MDP7024377.1 FMN-binding protein [Kiritimatiellia bacterium]